MNQLPDYFAQIAQSPWADTVDKLARTPQSTIVLIALALTLLRFGMYAYMKGVPIHLRTAGYKTASFVFEASDAIVYAAIFVFLVIRPYCLQTFRIPSGSMVTTLLVNDFIVANKAIYRYADPKDGEVVVFRPPVAAVTPDQIDPDGQVNVDFIKRCIGCPGDVIEMKDDVIYRNGKKLDEPYVHYTKPIDFEHQIFKEETPAEYEAEPKDNFKLVLYKGKYWPVRLEGALVNADADTTRPPYLTNDPDVQKALRDAPPAAIPKGYYLMLGDNRNGSSDGRAWGLVSRDDIVGRAEFIWLPLSRMSRIRSYAP